MNLNINNHFLKFFLAVFICAFFALIFVTSPPSLLAQALLKETDNSIESFNNNQVCITSYNEMGSNEDVVCLSLTGEDGYNSDTSSLIGTIVNTDDYSYVLSWIPNTLEEGLQLCKIRADYKLPAAGGGFSDKTSYFHIAGSAMRPLNSGAEYTTNESGGCIYLVGGSPFTIFNTHLNIPQRSQIEYLRVDYYRKSEKPIYLPLIFK